MTFWYFVHVDMDMEMEMDITHALGFQMRSAQTVHVLVEIHHLEAIELIGYRLDLLLLAGLDSFDARRVPLDICAWGLLVLAAGLDSAAGDFAIVDVLNPVVGHGASFDSCSAHLDA
jgi:hypothetical protein